nr:Pyrroline-5-carboxylate reductase [Cupriavidus sp.]
MNTPSQSNFSLLFIGGGNMAQAMLAGLIRSDAFSEVSIQVVEPDEDNRQRISQQWGARVSVVASCQSLAWAGGSQKSSPHASLPDWIVLAVKPQHAQEALASVCQRVISVPGATSLLSIAAGLTIASLQKFSGLQAIVRTMPNTPAMVQQGITGAYAVPQLSSRARAQADSILRCLGGVVWVDNEGLLDAVTAVSGSGPAYVFYFLEAFAAAGEKLGLSADESYRLALQTIKGAIALLEHSGETPAALRTKVTSKGGTTAAALGVLQSSPGGLGALMEDALRAAHHRAQELSRQ